MTKNAKFVKNVKRVVLDGVQHKFRELLLLFIRVMKNILKKLGCEGCYQYDPIKYREFCNKDKNI